jgi:PadR family transcriptional regulator PadR
VSVRAHHHYDRLGLLEARRGTSGYRIYGAEDVAVLEQIVALKFITVRREPPSRVALLQGTLDLLILRTLIAGPTHGHAIAKHIQRTSEDLLQVETGSLYPALHRLEVKDWIAASCELSAKGTRARFLSPHAARAQTAGCRTIEVGGRFPRHGIGPEPED